MRIHCKWGNPNPKLAITSAASQHFVGSSAVRFTRLIVVLCTVLGACGTRTIGHQTTARGGPGGSPADDLHDAEPHHPGDHGEPELEDVFSTLPPPAEQAPHPFAELSDAELEKILLEEPETLGTASLGKTSGGALFGAIPMPESEMWKIVNPRETYGTQETIDYLMHTIHRVNEIFPDTGPLNIGDISRPEGGRFGPHVSHQSGRDVDLGFYYQDDSKWYARADASNLDIARTWAFIKITISETDVQAIFVDRSLITLFRDYATAIGEDPVWIEQVFGGPGSSMRPMLLHEDGHQTHLHVRYYNPIAQETGRRIYASLIKHKKIQPPTYFQHYKAKKGDSLNRIAKNNRTTVADLKRANGLRDSRIFAGRSYKIPRRGGVALPGKLVLPARRTPGMSPALEPDTSLQSASAE